MRYREPIADVPTFTHSVTSLECIKRHKKILGRIWYGPVTDLCLHLTAEFGATARTQVSYPVIAGRISSKLQRRRLYGGHHRLNPPCHTRMPSLRERGERMVCVGPKVQRLTLDPDLNYH